MPAGGAQEYMVQLLALVGQTKHVLNTTSNSSCFLLRSFLIKCSAAVEKTVLVSALCGFFPLYICIEQEAPPFYISAINIKL